jgi:hypothetical protein
MELTGDCKKEFEKWAVTQDEIYLDGIHLKIGTYYNSISFYYSSPNSIRYGVYVDFFDSVGLIIENKVDTDWDYKRITYYTEIEYNFRIWSTMSYEYETRNEARTQAITKANELFNNK